MTELVLWMLLVLSQGKGPWGTGFGSLESCQHARNDIMRDSDTLVISECLEVKLLKPILTQSFPPQSPSPDASTDH